MVREGGRTSGNATADDACLADTIVQEHGLFGWFDVCFRERAHFEHLCADSLWMRETLRVTGHMYYGHSERPYLGSLVGFIECLDDEDFLGRLPRVGQPLYLIFVQRG